MKNPDPAGTLARLMAAALSGQLAALNVAIPCRVMAFDTSTCKATVQPLIRSGSANPALIQSVPALGQRLSVGGVEQVYRPALHVGDTVLVVCADREIKNALSGQMANPDSGRTHNINDAVIVGVFPASLVEG
ncbi:Gp138 family membrane-puncturing spike protein [Paenibacillus sepulcri]|uniref:Phage protein Gp138 N-terminal domain-containing protein n=1 Tax=Paenibacillus sepulcri TaxID=359917 RepID=A0ABS7BUU9_9BACL|nr:hypothetical protein [Paenibacillus sepulcri]